MHRRIIAAAAMALSLSTFAAQSVYAAPPPFFHHTADKPAAQKLIAFTVRNDSKAALVLQAGDQQYTVQPGKSTSLKLQEGAEVLTVNGTSSRAPGTVLTKVTKELQGNTLAIS